MATNYDKVCPQCDKIMETYFHPIWYTICPPKPSSIRYHCKSCNIALKATEEEIDAGHRKDFDDKMRVWNRTPDND